MNQRAGQGKGKAGLSIAAVALAGVVAIVTAWARPDDPERELEAVRERIDAVKTALTEARGKRDALVERLRETEQAIGRASRSLEALRQRLADQEAELGELERERNQLEDALGRHRRLLGRQLRAAYLMGRQERIKLLLNQEDPATVGRAMTYYRYLNRARSEQISAVAERLERLRSVEQAIETRRQRLAKLRDRRAAEVQALRDTRAQREAVLGKLEARIRDKGARLDQLEADASHLQRLVRELGDVFADLPSGGEVAFGELKGRLPWPATGQLVARYGQARPVGNLRWRGVVIDAPAGRTVRAISHGRVAFADWLRGFGLLIIIDHGDGYMSLYAHNQSLYKDTGEWIEAGEAIATVGTSGGSERSALYFELRHKGQPINPLQWCRHVDGNRIARGGGE